MSMYLMDRNKPDPQNYFSTIAQHKHSLHACKLWEIIQCTILTGRHRLLLGGPDMIPVLSVCQSRQSAHFFVTESCTTIYVDEQFNLAY